MGIDISFYSFYENKVLNSKGKIEINKGFSEIAYFGKRFYPICKYFEKKYNYDQDEIDFLEISPDQLKEFLEVVKKKELLDKKELKNWKETFGGNDDYKNKSDEKIKKFFHNEILKGIKEVEEEAEENKNVYFRYSY